MATPRTLTIAAVAMTILGLTLGGCTFKSSDEDIAEKAPTTTIDAGAVVDAPPPPPVVLEPVGARLEEVVRLDKPVAFAVRPGGSDIFIGEQGGTVRRLVPQTGQQQTGQQQTGQQQAGQQQARQQGDDQPPNDGRPFRVITRPVLDISAEVRNQGEQGLLGMTFSPDGRRLFVHYSDTNGDTQVVSYAMTADAADLSTRQRVFSTTQPQPNHNGGQLAFGPDGYLYLGLGDGGGFGDPDSNGQNPGTVLGSVLRIDPDGATGDLRYSTPPDNPFASVGGAPEVWLFGVRNPWRFSFDRLTGDLWLADVGEGDIEEVNLLPAQESGAGRGANLGWPLYEGSLRYAPGEVPDELVTPMYEYTHDEGCSVTGGFMYRGSAIEALANTYVFGDFCSAPILGLRVIDGVVEAAGPIGVSVDRTASFGQDNNGELWILSLDGPVYRLLPS